jgi:hypothetical protein
MSSTYNHNGDIKRGLQWGKNMEMETSERIVLWQQAAVVTRCAIDGDGSSSNSTGRSELDAPLTHSHSGKLKRNRSDDDPRPPDDKDNDQRKNRKKGLRLPNGRERFKCLFYLRHPNQYWPNACRGNGWRSMKDLW